MNQRGFLTLEIAIWSAFLAVSVTAIAAAYQREYTGYRAALVEMHRPLEGRKRLLDGVLPGPLEAFFEGVASVCDVAGN